MSANISHFTPDPSVKTCLVYLQGNWPPKNSFYVEKDLTLPIRLYPNAEFYIRCNRDTQYIKNFMFFNKLYKGRKFKLISDKKYDISAYEGFQPDVVWFIHFNFVFFGGVIDNYTFGKWLVTQNYPGKVHILFNEEMTKTYEPLWDYIQHRNENFKKLNSSKIRHLKDKTDWTNVTLLCNEDKLSQWVNERPIQKCLDGGINISYLTDKVLYDLPEKDKVFSKVIIEKRGIYIGKFIPKRISVINKLAESRPDLDIRFEGPDSDKLKYMKGFGDSMDNASAKMLMQSQTYGYSIYIGKGTPSLYLGATFYEPILNGIPVFVWDGTDPEHKLFPESEVSYFTDFADLYKKVEECDLNELWNYQISKML